jgi:putative transposase
VSRRPPRLGGFDYVGQYRHFLTFSTHRRQRAFVDATFAAHARDQLLIAAARDRFAVAAFCFMPDHAHLLLSGTSEDSSLLPMVHRWRQITGFLWRRCSDSHLWQEGYWDRVLRETDDTLGVAAYIVNNPVRAGLTRSVCDYAWSGSSEYTLQQLAEAIQMEPDPYSGGRG